MFENISQDTVIYGVLTLLVYSGLGSWLLNRFTRSREDMRRDARAIVSENIALIDSMRRLREQSNDEQRLRELDQMLARLERETAMRVEELNAEEEEELNDPSLRYLILPTPRTPFGAVLSVVFAVCVYFGIAALLTLGVMYANSDVRPLNSIEDLDYFVKVVGFGVALIALAFLARFAAFRSFKAHARAHSANRNGPMRLRKRMTAAVGGDDEGGADDDNMEPGFTGRFEPTETAEPVAPPASEAPKIDTPREPAQAPPSKKPARPEAPAQPAQKDAPNKPGGPTKKAHAATPVDTVRRVERTPEQRAEVARRMAAEAASNNHTGAMTPGMPLGSAGARPIDPRAMQPLAARRASPQGVRPLRSEPPIGKPGDPKDNA